MQVPVGAGERRRARAATPRPPTDAAVPLDDDGPPPAPAPSPRRRRSRSGAPRPTTTGSAGWPRAGRRPGSTASSAASSASSGAARRPSSAATYTTAAGIEVPHEATYTPLAGGAISVDETVEIPDELDDLAARRDRPGARARSRGPALVRLRAARDLPGPQARRARSAAGSRPSATSTSRTSARRRTAATPTSAGWSSPTRDDGDRRPDRARRARARSRSRTSAPPTSPRRPTTSTSSRSRRPSSISTPPTAGSGTASCGPDTLPEYRLGPGTYRWAWTVRDLPRPDRCRSRWSPETRELHLHNGRISYVMRVHDNGTLGHLHFGAPLDPGPLVRATSSRPSSPASRTASATRSRSNTRRPGTGDYRIPALTVELRRRLDRPRPRLPRAPDRPRQAGTARGRRPAGDLRRGRRRGRHARGRPRRRPERPRASSSRYTIFRDRPVIARSARIRNGGTDHRPPDRRDERRPRPPRRALGVRPAERRLGAREPRRDPPPAPGPPVGRQRPRRLEPPAQPVHRPAPADDDRGRPARPTASASSTRATSSPRPRSTRSTRPGSGSGSARTRSPGRLEPGAAFATPGGGPRLLGRRARGDERRAPRPLPRAPGARLVARPAAAGPHQQLGGDLLRLRRGEAARDRDGARATSASSCSCSTTAGSASATPTRPSLGDWFVDRRKLPNGLDGLATNGRGARHRVRAVDRARDGQRAEPAVRGAPGLGDRRPGPAADREPPAARARHVTAGGRRPPGRRPVRGARAAPRSRTSSGT